MSRYVFRNEDNGRLLKLKFMCVASCKRTVNDGPTREAKVFKAMLLSCKTYDGRLEALLHLDQGSCKPEA